MIFLLVCPVLFLFGGCNSDTEVRITIPVSQSSGYAHPGPLYNVTVPDSINYYLVWEETIPLFVSSSFNPETVDGGDTLLIGRDPFFSVEMERVEMSLSIAVAMGDSFTADSLQAILADSSSFVYYTTPHSGIFTGFVEEGMTLQPGDTLAAITGSPPDSLYLLSPDYNHIKWPGSIEGCIITESGLECTGPIPSEPVALTGVWSVEPRFIHEEGLRSFLLASSGDTLQISILGTTDTSKVIYSPIALDSLALTPW